MNNHHHPHKQVQTTPLQTLTRTKCSRVFVRRSGHTRTRCAVVCVCLRACVVESCRSLDTYQLNTTEPIHFDETHTQRHGYMLLVASGGCEVGVCACLVFSVCIFFLVFVKLIRIWTDMHSIGIGTNV